MSQAVILSLPCKHVGNITAEFVHNIFGEETQ